MWKTHISLRAATEIFPQPYVKRSYFIHSLCGQNLMQSVIHSLSFHIPQTLWIKIERKNPYRQLLMLAVISRILFCRLVSPDFSIASTLRIACITVV